MTPKSWLATALLSDVGRVRSNNEDSIAEDRDIGLLVLADGMGGYNAGEIASGITIATVLDTVRREWENTRADSSGTPSPHALLLRHAIETAHTTIYHVSQSQRQCAGMGTTVVACILHEDRLAIAYVGDSRLYRLRQHRLEAITRDHSALEELIARGHYSRAEAQRLVRKNIITRALGVEPEVTVDLIDETLQLGDVVLLCSDGLTDMVEENDIQRILVAQLHDLDAAAKTLVATANERGGRDNVSVALARVDHPAAPRRSWVQRLLRRP
jgi:PPM family protein phosphatase